TGIKAKAVNAGDPGFTTGDIATAKNNNIEPRVNFSCSPLHDRKTVIRGGYNIFSSNAFASINSPGQSAANAPGWNQKYDWYGSFYPIQFAPFSGQYVAFPLSDTTASNARLSSSLEPIDFPLSSSRLFIGSRLLEFL